MAWSPFKQNVLATRSADADICLWDTRQKNAAKKLGTLNTGSGTGCIRWNRHNSMLLASSRYGELFVWDIRKPQSAVLSITAHAQYITAIDWAYNHQSHILSASDDTTVKFWDIAQEEPCRNKLRIGVPIHLAQFTPFGNGLFTVGRGETAVSLWSTFDFSSPIARFSGAHTEPIQAVEWRTYNAKAEVGLVSWGKDKRLCMWSISKSLREACKFAFRSASSTDAGPAEEMPQFLASDRPSGVREAHKDLASGSPPPQFGLAMDLSQEFAVVAKKMSGVTFLRIEQTDTINRSCILVMEEADGSVLRVNVLFPSFYPHAQPSFVFLDGEKNSTTNERKVFIKRSLTHVAHYFAMRGRPCLEQCAVNLFFLQQERASDLRKEAGETSPPKITTPEAASDSNSSESRAADTAMKSTTSPETSQHVPEPPPTIEIVIDADQPQRKGSLSKEAVTSPPKAPALALQQTHKGQPVTMPRAINKRMSRMDLHDLKVAASPFGGSLHAGIGGMATSFEDLIGSLDVSMSQTSCVLSIKDFQKLHMRLPARHHFSSWHLLYSTMIHGVSLSTFYKRVAQRSPTILVVQDAQKHVFGGFCTGEWSKDAKVTGTGESFLFTISPYFKIYPWTKLNEQFMCGLPDAICLGGGSAVGLWLGEDFEHGTSKPCETYRSDCLASSEDFSVIVVEAWGL